MRCFFGFGVVGGAVFLGPSTAHALQSSEYLSDDNDLDCDL